MNEGLGLLRLTGFSERQKIEHDVKMCFSDVYETIDGMQDLTRDLEMTLNRIFHGESFGKSD